MASRTTLLVLGATLLSVAAFACNGKVDSDETSGSTTSQSRKGKGESSDTLPPSTPVPAPVCTHSHGSSSGGGDGAGKFFCESAQSYTCPTGDETITCSCTSQNGVWAPGTCGCNGLTFAFDCADGCGPGPAEFAKCNLPAPPSSGESGSGSSGGSSSSTSSSGG